MGGGKGSVAFAAETRGDDDESDDGTTSQAPAFRKRQTVTERQIADLES